MRAREKRTTNSGPQLLSTSVSNAIKLLFPEGNEDGLDCFKEMADFAQLTDEWFDCWNSQSKHPFRKKWKTAKHGFEVNYDYQLPIIQKFSKVVENLIIDGRTGPIDWQNGVLVSNKALELLFVEMKETYGVKKQHYHTRTTDT